MDEFKYDVEMLLRMERLKEIYNLYEDNQKKHEELKKKHIEQKEKLFRLTKEILEHQIYNNSLQKQILPVSNKTIQYFSIKPKKSD